MVEKTGRQGDKETGKGEKRRGRNVEGRGRPSGEMSRHASASESLTAAALSIKVSFAVRYDTGQLAGPVVFRRLI